MTDDNNVYSIQARVEAAATKALAKERAKTDIPEFSDFALADKFVAAHGASFRHVTNRGDWYFYDGKVWGVDEKLHRFTLAREMCDQMARGCEDEAVKKRLTDVSTVPDVLKVAGYDAKIIALIGDFDQHPMLLNTQEGIVDLTNGDLLPHDPEYYFSQITSCGVGGECRRWLQFIDEIACGDAELAKYLQRLVGYALTGLNDEEKFFFLYGLGANGKSKFLEAISNIMNTYHRTAPMSTFIASNTPQHPTDLAGLAGRRTVTAIETEQGRTWDENKIKAITGRDQISARFMRGDFFDYTPQYKILIAGNNKPKIKSTDEAIKRRLDLVPFLASIPNERRDLKLGEKLKAEYSGILKWAVDGCIEWQKIGLCPPPIVREATDEYFRSQNMVGNWISERCDTAPGLKVMSGDLYADFKAWVQGAGEEPLKRTEFNEALEKMQYRLDRTKHGAVWTGLKLRSGDGGDEC